MLVKIKQAHKYRGPRMKGPRAPRPRQVLRVGQVVEMPAEYYEKYLEPYGFGAVIQSVEAEDRQGLQKALGRQGLNVLRTFAKQLGSAEELAHLKGSGKNGAVRKADVVAFLLALEDQEELAGMLLEVQTEAT